ncbi:MAG: Gfo/Idh/MocA family oxidoreductase [Candidatus Gastranaerophilales bacterium]|nr:Gfo/Idh/MocA family oxidoreductase [Candidatus Gastranaerophilales bacterium]
MIKIALIGCGRIVKRHSELLGNNQIEHAKLAAVCDIDLQKAKAVGERFNVPFYSDMHEMMQKERNNIDAITILTPSGIHAQHVIELASYKKHIIVEKPMALTLDDADEMIKTCDKNRIRLFVVKQNRFNTPVKKLREALEANRFGKLIMGTVRVRWCRPQEYYDLDAWRGTWKYDGGVLTNQASHHIDLLEWMMGEVDSVFAKSTTALVDIETEDTAVVILKFRNGALGVVEATTATRPKDLEGSISILGEGGSVEIGGFAVNEMKVWNFVDQTSADKEILEKYSVNPPNVYGFGHKEYYDHVIDCILNDKQALIDGFEGRKSLELISAIYESIESGQEIYLRFRPDKCRLGARSKSQAHTENLVNAITRSVESRVITK